MRGLFLNLTSESRERTALFLGSARRLVEKLVAPAMLLMWFVSSPAHGDFSPLGVVRGVIWFPDLDEETVSELCEPEDELPVFHLSVAESFSCGGADDELELPSGTDPLIKVIVRTANSEIRVRVTMQTEEKASHLFLDESFSSSLPPELLLGDARMGELIMLMVLDSLPAVLRLDGPEDERVQVEGWFRSLGIKPEMAPATLSFDAVEGLFRADDLVASDRSRKKAKEQKRAVYLLQKSGRLGNLPEIRNALFQRLLTLTREDAERVRASAVGIFVGVASDFVNEEPRFILQSVVKVSLSPYLRFAFALDGIQNSIPIETQVTAEEGAEEEGVEVETTRRTTLSFDEVMLRPSIVLGLPQDLTGVDVSFEVGYAFYLQKLSPVDLTTNIFPTALAEINDFAPAVGLGVSRVFGEFRADLFGDYSQTVGTGRRFRRLMGGFNLSATLSTLTLGVVEKIAGYVGVSARYLSHQIEIQYENQELQGSLLSTIPTPAAGLYIEVLL